MRSAKDRTGEVNGLLNVLYRGIDENGFPTWVCSCACTQWSKFRVRGADLERTLSCGCVPAERVRRRSCVTTMPTVSDSIGQEVVHLPALPMAA